MMITIKVDDYKNRYISIMITKIKIFLLCEHLFYAYENFFENYF